MIPVRDRLSDRVGRARLKLELTRARRPAVVVALGLAAGLVCFGVIALNVSKSFLRDTYEVRFAVREATGVVPGRNEVRFRGIPAGTITDVEIGAEGPVLVAEIQRKYGPVHRDARAALRPSTALEDMYLDILDPGSPAAGELSRGSPLEKSRTETAVNVEDVLNVFRADVRTNLRALLDNLGNGIGQRGDALRAAFVELTPFLHAAGRMSEQLADRAAVTRRLMHNTALLTTELGRRDRQLRTLVTSGGSMLRTFQAGAADLDATLRELPPTLTAIDTSFAAVRRVLGDVDAAVTSLGPVAQQLPASLSALRRLGATARPALRDLQPPVRRLVPLADALLPLSSNLGDAAVALQPQTDTFDHFTRNVVRCERPIQGFFHWDASLFKFSDLRGGVPRGNAEYNLTTTGALSDPNAFFHEGCAPGKTVGGRPPTPEDEQ